MMSDLCFLSDLSRPQAHLINLAPTPFLRTFASAVIRTLSLAGDDINELTLSEDGHILGWAGDEGRLGLGELASLPALPNVLASHANPNCFVVDLRTNVKTWMKGKHTSVRSAPFRFRFHISYMHALTVRHTCGTSSSPGPSPSYPVEQTVSVASCHFRPLCVRQG